MLPNSKSLLPVAQSFGTAVRVLHAPRWIAHQCLVTLFFFSRVFFNSPFLPQPVIAHLPLFIHLCSVVCITLCIHLQIMACMNLLLALPSCVCPATALPELYRPPVHACTLQSHVAPCFRFFFAACRGAHVFTHRSCPFFKACSGQIVLCNTDAPSLLSSFRKCWPGRATVDGRHGG